MVRVRFAGSGIATTCGDTFRGASSTRAKSRAGVVLVRMFATGLSTVAIAGCAPGLSQLDATERQQHERIEQLDTQIRADEARAERARLKAEYEDCRANRESIVASAAAKVAACEENQAKQSECEAQNEKHKGHTAVGGCVLGILAAALTAGGGAPLALAGCGGGLLVGHMTTEDCKKVDCDPTPDGAMHTALAEHGATTLPLCGGVVGVILRQGPGGVEVAQVDPAGPGAASGIAPGDVLAALDGKAILNVEEAARAALDLPAPGETVAVVLVRRGQPFQVHVPLAVRRLGQLGL